MIEYRHICHIEREPMQKTANLGLLAFLICLSSLTCILTCVALSAEEDSAIKATIRADGSLMLQGSAKYIDLVFGGADTGFSDDSPVGIRAVTLGQHLYVQDEKNGALLKQLSSPQRNGTLNIGTDGITRGDHRDEGGWLSWSSDMARSLGQKWSADIPGQLQVLVEVNASGNMRMIEKGAFFPATDSRNNFVTAANSPRLIERFAKSINDAIGKLDKSQFANFPSASAAKSVVFMATFVADHDLQISVPDFSTFSGLAEDEQSLRIARICSILDASYLSNEADHLRLLLPEALRHNFIPDGVQHQFYSKTRESFFVIDRGSITPNSTDWKYTPYVNLIFDRYIAIKKFKDAERFAKYLSGESSHTGNGTQKLITEQLDLLGETREAARLRSE